MTLILRVLVGRFLACAADDQRRTRLVDQDRVHLVHDAEVVSALHAVLHVELHVVAQIVEAEFVVGSVGDVAAVGGLALIVVQVVDDHAHRQSQKAVQLSHPLRVALGQVVVHRHHVHAASGQRIQIHRQGRHQRLAFARLHLGDAPAVQHHAADQLHVEVAHVQRPPSRLAHHRKRLFQQCVQHFLDSLVLFLLPLLAAVRIHLFCRRLLQQRHPLLHPAAEFIGLGPQLRICQLANLGLQRVDALHARLKLLHFALVMSPENLCHQRVNQCYCPSELTGGSSPSRSHSCGAAKAHTAPSKSLPYWMKPA